MSVQSVAEIATSRREKAEEPRRSMRLDCREPIMPPGGGMRYQLPVFRSGFRRSDAEDVLPASSPPLSWSRKLMPEPQFILGRTATDEELLQAAAVDLERWRRRR